MIYRESSDRGITKLPWLDSRHTFSFGGYSDPNYMGFQALRVINEDRIQGGEGFGAHPHREMEIITYVMKGALQHRDSLGTESILRAGDVQRMTAGTGIIHSEFNASSTDEVHLLQIWMYPNQRGLDPSYEEKSFGSPTYSRELLVSPSGRDGSLRIHQDAEIYRIKLDRDEDVSLEDLEGSPIWLQVYRGELVSGKRVFEAGDGIGITEDPLRILEGEGEALLFRFGVKH
jgi:quercetin 2,3-dioxygenase